MDWKPTHLLIIVALIGLVQSAPNNRTIGILLYPGWAVLDVFGPMEFWNMVSNSQNLTLAIIANQVGPVSTLSPGRTSGIGEEVVAHYDFETAPPLDILIIPGGTGARAAANDTKIIAFIQARFSQLEYLCALRTGAAIAAKAGVLDGRSATTNKFAWTWATSQGPRVQWIPEARFVQDGNVLTSAGTTAGMDLTYHFVKILYGETLAARSANIMEYAPFTNANWDPFYTLWIDGVGNTTVPVDPCVQQPCPSTSSSTTPSSQSTSSSIQSTSIRPCATTSPSIRSSATGSTVAESSAHSHAVSLPILVFSIWYLL
eukprot:TRINITY_DN1822_c0_g1_i1.p1 TRINITY_DN1822_c0_g1~~TRINITY_DN1822_c0_g1_i1.p1  ORF type:complete len:316 (-),score=54.04 TRINITY_DN1822_c0_g1_i1:43-990(-)